MKLLQYDDVYIVIR